MNDDLLELQTQLSYQEDTVAQLNDVVTRQQRDIERLYEMIALLKKQLDTVASSRLEPQDEAPPPHY